MGASKPTAPREGICKLTLREGTFVDSHIIPEALTRTSVKGNPLFQFGEGTSGSRPVRRWTSWDDRGLVTSDGEKLLSDLDSWAVSELRKNRLVWSGWGDERTLGPHHTQIPGLPIGVRQVDGIDPIRLRLFFLSLLWRAAATTLEEFSEVELAPDDVETLRLMIVNGDAAPISFYPCQLTQMSTKGPIRNHTPFRDAKFAPDLSGDGSLSIPMPTYRFYFDGLVANMHIGLPDGFTVENLGSLLVGVDRTVVLSTVTFEDSLQLLKMRALIDEVRAADGMAQSSAKAVRP